MKKTIKLHISGSAGFWGYTLGERLVSRSSGDAIPERLCRLVACTRHRLSATWSRFVPGNWDEGLGGDSRGEYEMEVDDLFLIPDAQLTSEQDVEQERLLQAAYAAERELQDRERAARKGSQSLVSAR